LPFTFRQALVVGALSAATLGATTVTPAMAEDATASSDCVTATAQVAHARTAFVAARNAFVASNKPLGKLLFAERAAARTELRTAQITMHRLQRQVAKTHDKAARAALLVQVSAERADIRHSTRLLDSKTALRAQALADRAVAKTAFAAARTASEAAEVAADTACGDTTDAAPTD
jgi:hypothetical protein